MKHIAYTIIICTLLLGACKKEYIQSQGQAMGQKLAATLAISENSNSTTLYNVAIVEDNNTTILYQSTLNVNSTGVLVITSQGRELSFNLEELKYYELSASDNLTLKF